MTEHQRPDMSFIANEALSKNPQTTLSAEFAGRVNNLVGLMPDGEEIATLFARYDSRIAQIAYEEGRIFSAPPERWSSFMATLTHKELVQLKKVIRNGFKHFNLRTLGDVRDFSAKPANVIRWIGPVGKAFMSLGFREREYIDPAVGDI